MPRRSSFRLAAALALASTFAACGKSPSAPGTSTGSSQNTATKCSVIVGNNGSVTASVDGATFTGITPTGGAANTGSVLTLFGTNTDDTTITLGATATTGTQTFGDGIISGDSLTLQTRSCSAGTGTWMANISGGSGTITVATISSTGVTGTFSGTLVPVANSGATGNKVITNGRFDVKF